MNPTQDPKSGQPAEIPRIPFLLSRQLDGDLTPDESSALALFQQTDAQRGVLAAMTDLRGQLKALPVKPVSASFATSVHNAVDQLSAKLPGTSARVARRGRIVRVIVAVSVTACAAALMLLLQRPADNSHQLSRASDSPAAGQTINTPANSAAAGRTTVNVSTKGEGTAPPSTVAELNVSAQQNQMQVFIENDDWDIVVVQVHSKDRNSVMRNIEALVAQHDMDIKPVAGNDRDGTRFGILLTSTGVKDNAFIESVVSETDAESADWNVQSVANSTRKSLIHSLQESLKTPTHSELHFGQVYIALPKFTEQNATASGSLVAQNDAVDAVDAASLPSAATRRTALPPDEVATNPPMPSARRTPVLVVFEFTDMAPEHI